jgi:murein DD-endopeptidase MepM/ murein hydrolase activator NlpD
MVSPYRYRIHPIFKGWRLHNGVGLAGGCNVPIYAATGGRVSFSGLNGGYSNFIVLDYGNGMQSAYAHIIDGGRLVLNRQTVTAGQLIARTGSIGGSTACHLHFEVRSGGFAFDPVPFMRERGVALG